MSDEQVYQPSDDSRITRLSSLPPRPAASDAAPGHDLSTPASDDAVVREYEQRYTAAREPKAKIKAMPRSYSTAHVSEEERMWAAAAHASAWLTLLGGIVTIGAIIPLSIFVPLVIYFVFRKKSDFVAFHALQAFVLQLLGTVGALVLLLVGGTIWTVGMVVSALLVMVLVGVILVPLWGVIGIALLLVVLALPFAMLFYSAVAGYRTYRGEDYRYPFIARWVDRQLAGGLLNAT
ncbi:MAG: DUF4870 domain-containing protein [Chloroflexota bacterium]|nr:DUF4870 domain-containing protein [Chloroflexota bacterium]